MQNHDKRSATFSAIILMFLIVLIATGTDAAQQKLASSLPALEPDKAYEVAAMDVRLIVTYLDLRVGNHSWRYRFNNWDMSMDLNVGDNVIVKDGKVTKASDK